MSRYSNLKYSDLDRWSSYWYQIKEIMDAQPEKILEIGVGDKTVNGYLKTAGRNVVSLDIDPSTEPDIVGSVESIPFPDKSFDLILCAEVLEHLPFEKFAICLAEIRRVTTRRAVITLPHWGRHFSLEVRLPYFKRAATQHKFGFWPMKHKVGEHHWEIGKADYDLSRIRTTIETSGFSISKDYVMFESPYHHMFVLEARSK